MRDGTTPIEMRSGVWVKRDDLYDYNGAIGGKARSCAYIAERASGGLTTAASHGSPQGNIVARIGAALGLPVRVHTPTGKPSAEQVQAEAFGAERITHTPGYNNVIGCRARQDAEALGWTYVPFGMETPVAVEQTASQVRAIPPDVRRIVMAVGSGMSIAGVVEGSLRLERPLPILGVSVGAKPWRCLDKFAPRWREVAEIVGSGLPYKAHPEQTCLDGLELDPIYESKCLPHLRDGDLLWVVGIRPTAR